jgi:hypothetical protein
MGCLGSVLFSGGSLAGYAAGRGSVGAKSSTRVTAEAG